jgi:hypothetical protein
LTGLMKLSATETIQAILLVYILPIKDCQQLRSYTLLQVKLSRPFMKLFNEK